MKVELIEKNGIVWMKQPVQQQQGGGSGGGGSTTTVQKADPWSGQQPYLTDTFKQAQNLDQTYTPSYYGGNTNGLIGTAQSSTNGTVAPLSNATLQSVGQGEALANNDPTNSAANRYLQNTMSNQYLSAGNPYMQGMMNQVAQQVIPETSAPFESSNRYGSGAAQAATAGALANADSSMAYNNFNTEQSNQLKAASLAPGQNTANWNDVNSLNNVGSVLDNQNQAMINANVNKWNYNQQLPYNKLNAYAAITNNGSYGTSGTSTATQQMYRSPIASAMGGGVIGATVGNSIWGSTGGALGGILGAAGGAMS